MDDQTLCSLSAASQEQGSQANNIVAKLTETKRTFTQDRMNPVAHCGWPLCSWCSKNSGPTWVCSLWEPDRGLWRSGLNFTSELVHADL